MSSSRALAAADWVTEPTTDPVLAAVVDAPLVVLTAHEEALLAEIEGRPVEWIAHEEFAAKLGRAER